RGARDPRGARHRMNPPSAYLPTESGWSWVARHGDLVKPIAEAEAAIGLLHDDACLGEPPVLLRLEPSLWIARDTGSQRGPPAPPQRAGGRVQGDRGGRGRPGAAIGPPRGRGRMEGSPVHEDPPQVGVPADKLHHPIDLSALPPKAVTPRELFHLIGA